VIVFGDKQHGERIAKAAGFLFNLTHDVVVCRVDDWGKLLGGVVYYDFTKRSISMHVAGFDPHWISRTMLFVTFDYPYRQLKCENIFCQVKSSNERTLKFIKKIGFDHEVTIKGVFEDADLVVNRMRVSTCKWLGLRPRGITRGGKSAENSGGACSVR
jgi:RimJ/RimL family protein N-acetyltransferase